MIEHNFTPTQTIKISKLLEDLHNTNTDLASDRKIEGIQYFKDKKRNFMCSYCELSFDDGNYHSRLYYIMITPDGEVIDAIELYGDEIKANNKCSRMTEIKLN